MKEVSLLKCCIEIPFLKAPSSNQQQHYRSDLCSSDDEVVCLVLLSYDVT